MHMSMYTHSYTYTYTWVSIHTHIHNSGRLADLTSDIYKPSTPPPPEVYLHMLENPQDYAGEALMYVCMYICMYVCMYTTQANPQDYAGEAFMYCIVCMYVCYVYLQMCAWWGFAWWSFAW